jgi:hypothetical protein
MNYTSLVFSLKFHHTHFNLLLSGNILYSYFVSLLLLQEFYSSGTHIVQADSGSDTESRHKERPFNSAGVFSDGRRRQVGQTVGVRRFTGMISTFLFHIQSDIGMQICHIVFYVFAF